MKNFLQCDNAQSVSFKKDEFIIEAGELTESFGILLEGGAHSLKWDASGKVIIISIIEKGGAIGILLIGRESPLSVQATEDSVVLMLPFAQLFSRCEKNCAHHEKLLQGYIALTAEKGLELHERINCLLEPTVRKKILTYLQKISHEKKSRTFILPINRNIMAEYLNVERSALSRELSRMKKDGLIDYHKNSFKLL